MFSSIDGRDEKEVIEETLAFARFKSLRIFLEGWHKALTYAIL